ncbi:MAG: RluA family pseudouridine synthase, partial [Bdellovibrionota bacterium]
SRILQARRVSLIEASPKTGRTHQIRVHLSENNLPILGDETYGVRFSGVKRVLLHAWKLELLGKTFHAPLPDDFRILDFHEPGE